MAYVQRRVRGARERLRQGREGGVSEAASGILGYAPAGSSGSAARDRLTGLAEDTVDGDFPLVHGDLDLQVHEHRGTTATLRVNAGWEQMPGDTVILGYYAGAHLRATDLEGDFSGSRTGYGFDAGAYAVGELTDTIHADGFAAVSLGRNDMDIGNGSITLASLYDTRSFMAGGSISGAFTIGHGVAFLPELAVRHGQTSIGSIGFTGHTDGVANDGLNLDAATLHVTTLTLRPELRHATRAGDGGTGYVSFAPRLVCEHTRAGRHCGYGAEAGYRFRSADSASSGDLELVFDEIDGTLRSRLTLDLKRRF